MTVITVEIPDSRAKAARALCEKFNIRLDYFISYAIENELDAAKGNNFREYTDHLGEELASEIESLYQEV